MEGSLIINSSCIQCGACLSCGFAFLSSNPDGSICVASGTYLNSESSEMSALNNVCPTKAFQIKESDKASVLDEYLRQLKSYKGIPAPTTADFRFNYSDYKIPVPRPSGEYRYNYSSSSAAERAGLDELNRVMYSQIDGLLLHVITDYRVKCVKPYYTAEASEKSVYAESNMKVSEILKGIQSLLGDKLPKDFSVVSVFPNRDTTWKMLNKGELVADELISSVRREFDNPLSDYACYIDSDDTEQYVGDDWRGRPKYRDMYCYSDVYRACSEVAEDLLRACKYSSSKLEECACRHAGWLVTVYNEELAKVISQKIQLIESLK